LDPRINYRRLHQDYKDEPEILHEIEQTKIELQVLQYYNKHYAGQVRQSTDDISSSYKLGKSSPQKIDFIARYAEESTDDSRNELEDYFGHPPESFRSCDPVAWWGSRAAQFPNLSCLARDILCIPGKH
jgi:hypothetical protein